MKTPKGDVPRLPEARARQERRRRAADAAGRTAARAVVPQADALGRDARRRPGRARCSAVRSAGCCSSTAAASCRSRSAAPPNAAGPLVQDVAVRRRDLRPSLPGDERPRRPLDQGPDASTNTGRGSPSTSSSSITRSGAIASCASSRCTRGGSAAASHLRDHAALLDEVADLVEYPGVVAGFYAPVFLELPHEVLTTTLVHHQHYFPVLDESRRAEGSVPRRREHAAVRRAADRARTPSACVTARLRDAKFFWDADRKTPLEDRARAPRTILTFHKKLGQLSRQGGAHRARWRGGSRRTRSGGRSRPTPRPRPRASPRPTSRPTWCSSSPSCRGRWAGSTRGKKGSPRQVWKAIYYHYLPIGVEADAPPTRAQLGRRGGDVGGGVAGRQGSTRSRRCSWRARSRPARAIRSGCAGRRTAVEVLVDLPELTGIDADRPASRWTAPPAR